MIAPVLMLFTSWHDIDRQLWQHVASYTLPSIIKNSLLLLLGTLSLTCLLGVSSAAIVTMIDFPGRKLFQALFIFPFVVPPYVFGFIYVSLFDSPGILQNQLRVYFPELFINIRNVYGLSLVLALSLFPYVFLFCRQAFTSQGHKVLEVGRTLGHQPLACFFLSSYRWPNLGYLGP